MTSFSGRTASWLVVLAMVLSISRPAPGLAAVRENACPRCDQVLELSDWQWDCLLGRRPELDRLRTPVIFFTLTEQTCAAQRSVGPRIPRAASGSPPAYTLSRTQLDCLWRRASAVQRSGSTYRFDFTAQCAR